MARRKRSRRSRRPRRVGLPGILLFVLLAAISAAAIFLASRGIFEDEPPPGEGEQRPPAQTAVGEAPEGGEATPPEPRERPPSSGPEPALPAARPGSRVAVVVDDLGRSLEDLDALAELGVPLTYAVLPFESRTPDVVRELVRRREEILVHLPMEATNGADPGPGALTLEMGSRELGRATRRALAAVPGAAGVNNHMGSSFSADPEAMRRVLSIVGEHGLYFLDSRTTVDTVGFQVATSLGLPSAERQVFLDRDPTPEAVRGEFRRLLALAREEGAAIAIGHPYPVTLEVLETEIPRAAEAGYEFVPVSYLLERTGGPAR